MAFADLYFLWKVYLHWRGYLQISALPNAALLASCWAISRNPRRPRALSAALAAAAALWAALLAWRESFFPPLADTIRYLLDPAQRPGAPYLWRSLASYLSGAPALLLLLGAPALWFLRRRLAGRFPALTAGSAVLLAAAAFAKPPADARALASDLALFYASEAPRRAHWPRALGRGPDFDIVLLHVCSLSWADLREAGLEQDPFFSSFDALLTRFNAVATYSSPAALRLLRANCGQGPHAALFSDAPKDCYLLPALESLGYSAASALNHDGLYQSLGANLERRGRAPAPLDTAGLPAARRNFNGSPILGDGPVLERWLAARAKRPSRREALYYNTVTLHSGSYRAGPLDPWSGDRVREYRAAASGLFRDLEGFFSRLRRSGRRTVVLFIPEHGAALRPSRLQGGDLRDIPLPDIAAVPVGIKLIAPGRPEPSSPALVDAPLSYLALGELLGVLLEDPSWGKFGPESLARLPRTRFVAENRLALVLEREGEPYLGWQGGKWVRLSREFGASAAAQSVQAGKHQNGGAHDGAADGERHPGRRGSEQGL